MSKTILVSMHTLSSKLGSEVKEGGNFDLMGMTVELYKKKKDNFS